VASGQPRRTTGRSGLVPPKYLSKFHKLLDRVSIDDEDFNEETDVHATEFRDNIGLTGVRLSDNIAAMDVELEEITLESVRQAAIDTLMKPIANPEKSSPGLRYQTSMDIALQERLRDMAEEYGLAPTKKIGTPPLATGEIGDDDAISQNGADPADDSVEPVESDGAKEE
jgi:hypothetical protein